MPSIFTRIVAGEIPCYKIAEDEHHLAFLDISPLTKGHTLVIPKREVDYIFDLEEDEYSSLNEFVRRTALAIKKAVPCNRVGICVMGLEVPHAHIHLIPFLQMAEMNFANAKLKLEASEMQQIAAKIAANW
ncbi:MAG: HIT family protein [bacterium]|nr:HIT family protein [bacterium]